MKIVITCEHGGNFIPAKYAPFFEGLDRRLASHEGWDIGALDVAREFSNRAGDYFFYTEVSRLLVELNRSLNHRQLFSDVIRPLKEQDQKYILDHYYYPYREQVLETMDAIKAEGDTIFHLSVHSFTPIFNNVERRADIGLLYDPRRAREAAFCSFWKSQIKQQSSELNVRFNYPYLGRADGLVTFLRKRFPLEDYVGIELEINQKRLLLPESIANISDILIKSFDNTLSEIENY